jgi:hypothetical protein
MATLATIERLGPITLGDLAVVERVQPPSMTHRRRIEVSWGSAATDADDRRRAPRSPTPVARSSRAAAPARIASCSARRT